MTTTRTVAAFSAAALGLLLLFALAPPAEAPLLPSGAFLIRDVRLFDGERLWPRASVQVRDGLIVAVGEALPDADGLPVLDGRGRTLLPGLIDAHVHTFGTARRDALRFGVTSMLDMFTGHGQLATARAERASLAATARSDLWSAGTLATADGGHGTQYGFAIPTVDRPAAAADWVAARRAEGSDYIKLVREDMHVYHGDRALPTLDVATAAALIEAAHSHGLRALVHASAQEHAREALRDGADGLVHVFQDQPADDAFVELAAARGAFVVPTLSVIAGFAGEASSLADDPRLAAWLTTEQQGTLRARMSGRLGNPALIANARASVRRLHAAGVPILAGTDAPNPNTAHGASLHEELVQLAQAGLEPLAALAAATSVPADAFGLSDRGRILAGRRADLLLVEGDPSRELAATRAIVAVWKNGHRVDRRPPAQQTATIAAGRISDFDGERIEAAFGAGWMATDDRMAGGRSQATLTRIAGGAEQSAGALRIAGEVSAGARQVWAGALFSPAATMMQPVDASGLGELVFQARGDGRSYAVLLFSGHDGQPLPVAQRFVANADWQEQRFALDRFAGADLGRLRAIAITAGEPLGRFELDIDAIELR